MLLSFSIFTNAPLSAMIGKIYGNCTKNYPNSDYRPPDSKRPRLPYKARSREHKGGQTIELGTVEVNEFQKVRLVCDERIGSTCNILVRMTIMEGNELVALLDQVLLTPHAQTTRVYDVPGTQLSISIDGIGAANTQGAVDVLLYGQY
jgi:hypothetical protein